MKETAKEVDTFIIEFLDKLKEKDKDFPFKEVAHLPNLRTSSKGVPKIRATFGRLLYEMINPHKDWKEIIPILSAIEIYSISTYVLDDIFDNQPTRQTDLATWKKYGLNKAIIAGILQRDIGGQMLLELKTSKTKLSEISHLYEKADFLLYIGQYLNEEMTSKITKDNYVKRCTALTNENPAMSKMIGIYSLLGGNELIVFEELGRKFGTLAMMRNDFMNLVPDKVKDKTTTSALKGKTFEDIRKGLWTYPIIKFFEGKTSKKDRVFLKNVLGNWDAKEEDLVKVIHLLIESGSIKLFASFIDKYKEETIKYFKDNFKGKDLDNFENFFHLFENIKPYYKLMKKCQSIYY